MIGDSFLSDAGFLFFTAWTVMIAAVSFAAFGSDLLPIKISLGPEKKSRALDGGLRPQSSRL
jgi:hypothetical protein